MTARIKTWTRTRFSYAGRVLLIKSVLISWQGSVNKISAYKHADLLGIYDYFT